MSSRHFLCGLPVGLLPSTRPKSMIFSSQSSFTWQICTNSWGGVSSLLSNNCGVHINLFPDHLIFYMVLPADHRNHLNHFISKTRSLLMLLEGLCLPTEQISSTHNLTNIYDSVFSFWPSLFVVRFSF